MKKRLFLIFFLTIYMVLSANVLLRFYHSNHGSVERLVFEFSDYPRYRIREDIFDVNLSFLDCGINPDVMTQDFEEQNVITRATFVKTDTFIGVLLNTFEGYGIEHFIIDSENGFKLVVDVFRYKDPPTVSMALNYAEFYQKVGYNDKALKYRNLAEKLRNKISNMQNIQQKAEVEKTSETPQVIEKEAVVKPDPVPEPIQYKEPEKVIEEVIEPEPVAEETIEEKPETSAYSEVNQKIPDILKDIYQDKLLMFSIVIVVVVVLLMLVMSIARAIRKKKISGEPQTSESFGSREFQVVTIKRLLSNGWQVGEISRELNLSPEEIEELGRGN